ncbi:MAG: AMP-binding protein [Vibrio sp.]
MDFLEKQADLTPDRIAIFDLIKLKNWTYKEFNKYIKQVQAWLVEQKLLEGDRLVCISKNCKEQIALHIACSRMGAMFVPINWRLSKPEIYTLLTDCQPKIILGDGLLDELKIDHFDIHQLDDYISCYEDFHYFADPSLPSLILYTSGTTGKPKGIMHSEETLRETALNMTDFYNVDINSVFLCDSPMFHVIGLISSIRPALYWGGSLVITDGFQPERTLELLSSPKYKVTHYFCVPQMANLLRHLPGYQASKLRNLTALLTGGAPHPVAHIHNWLNDGVMISDGYGMSEIGTIFGMPLDPEIVREHAGYVGLNTQRLQVRLDIISESCTGESYGELQFKGKAIYIGIWGDEAKYKETFTSDGWLKTGDLASINEAGYYKIVGRLKDMYISGGENVYPKEIEEVVLALDEINECSVFGVQDDTWGEVGCIVYSVSGFETLSESELKSYLEKNIAKYKIPKHFINIESLPKSGTGKLNRHSLMDIYKSYIK